MVLNTGSRGMKSVESMRMRRSVVKRSMFATTLALVALFGAVAPSFAKGESSGLDAAVGGAEWVTRLGGVGVGTVAGTPVAIVRQTFGAYTAWTPDLADKVGGKECGPACALVSLVTLPAAVVWGGVTGPYYGVKNGFNHGFNNPFTHDSFSLGSDYNGEGGGSSKK